MSASAAFAAAPRAAAHPNRTVERAFFAFMALLMLASVLVGFAPTYFLAGMVVAPLPNRLIHIHGAIFTLWIVFFLVQTALVTTRNVRVHRTLGVYGFAWAVLMCIVGPLAAIDQLHRGKAPLGMAPAPFFIIPLTAVMMFAGFVYWSWRSRYRPADHKRLILLATIALMDAAIGRWPVPVFQAHPPLMGFAELGFVVLLMLYDLYSTRRVQKVTLWGFGILFVVLFTRVPIGMSKPWIAFANLFLHH